MVCKRDWCVVRDGGCPMTRTGRADVAMSACGRASASRPVLARPGFRGLVSVWPLSHGLTVVGAVFPGSASLKPASCRLAGRSRRPQPHPSLQPLTMSSSHRSVRASGPPRPPCPRSSALTHPLYLYLPERPGTALPGRSFDPGRDTLCTFTPQWLQWP